jgi:Rod binding domain-containing protein
MTPSAAAASPASSSSTASPAWQRRRALDGFEAIFLHMLLEPLKKTTESWLGGGTAGDVMSGLFQRHMAEQMAAARPLGLARYLERGMESVAQFEKEST